MKPMAQDRRGLSEWKQGRSGWGQRKWRNCSVDGKEMKNLVNKNFLRKERRSIFVGENTLACTATRHQHRTMVLVLESFADTHQ